MSFDDTRPMTAAEFSASSEAIGRIQAKFDEEKLREENAMKLRKRTSRKRPHISSDEEDIDLEQLLEDSAKDKPKPASNINNMQKLTKPCIVSVQRINDTLKDELTKFSSDKQTVTLVENNTKAMSSSSEELSSDSDSAKTTDQSDLPDPLSKKFKRNMLNKMQNHISSTAVLGRKSISKAKSKLKLSIRSLQEGKTRQKALKAWRKCPANNCYISHSSASALRQHLKTIHHDFRWKCRCSQTFARRVGRYKHELRHKYGFRYQCDTKKCGYRCMFESEMQEHCRKHTQKDLYKCRVDPQNCHKAYPAKRNRNAHEKTHTSSDWTCAATQEDGSTCGQACVSCQHLAQHMQGFHGPGWNSRCGENFKWPSSKYNHEKGCTPCLRIKAKERRKKPLQSEL